jgi:endonuclease YncB( thermonuclease family)
MNAKINHSGSWHPAIAVRLLVAALVLFGAFQPAILAFAEHVVTGRIVGVHDGDTVTLLTPEKRQIRIRLYGIDAPEGSQPYGAKSKQALSDLCFGRTVTASYVDTDRYGRMVARVYAKGSDINADMVRRGAAWVYRKYTKDASLLALEAQARAGKRGLWSLPDAERIPPWEWRRPSAPSSVSRVISPAAPASPACGTKRACRQMSSCFEARFYLQSCGVASLDGDRDGVPCESLCR